MKYIIAVFAFFLFGSVSAQDNLSKKEVKNIQTFIQCIKKGDKDKLSTMAQYPLLVKDGKVKVKSKADFVKKYDLIFDKKLTQIILESKVSDWDRVGSKGVMLNEGEIWFNEGAIKLITVNGLEN